MAKPPNKRVQRTSLRSPLTRKTFGNTVKRSVICMLVIVAFSTQRLSANESAPKRHGDESLKLSLDFPEGLKAGTGAVKGRFVLENVSSVTIKVCLGQSWGVNVLPDSGGSGGESHSADHEGCVQSLELRAGDALLTSRTFEVQGLGVGPLRMNGWLKVVLAGTCDSKYGCDSRSVISPVKTYFAAAAK